MACSLFASAGIGTRIYGTYASQSQQDDLLQAFNNLLAQQPIWADVFFVI